MAELQRRRELNLRISQRFPLSGLLTCSVCGQKLHRVTTNAAVNNAGEKVWQKALSCRRPPHHIRIEYNDGVARVAHQLYKDLKDLQVSPPPPPSKPQSENILNRIDDLTARRKRVQAGYESGLYTPNEAAEKLAEINATAEKLQTQLEQSRREEATANELSSLITSDLLESLPEWIISDSPALVNRTISALCKKNRLDP